MTLITACPLEDRRRCFEAACADERVCLMPALKAEGRSGGRRVCRAAAPTVGMSRAPTRSQGFEVHDDLPLLLFRQIAEGCDDGLCLAGVAQDGLAEGQGLPVVHQPVARPHAP